VSEKQLRSTFSALAKLYGGEENALKMVKAVPNILAYNSANFKPARDGFLRAYVLPDEKGNPGKYTEQDVNEMVVRNPLLVGLRPSGFGGTENSGDDTMYISYVVAATRPLGPILLGGLALALLTPALKKLLGIE